MKRKICVITGSRAEYGHLQWLIQDIVDDNDLELQLVVTGMHLEKRFGNTYQEIENNGHAITAKIPIDETDDSPVGIAVSMGRCISEMARVLSQLNPDIAVILGDRYEMMAAAQAAFINRIPIAHIHGGETTEGAIDEAFRHSITKMSHLHFVAAEAYRKRVIQLGEDPDRVFNVGAPGLCALDRIPLMSRKELEKSLDFKLGEKFFLVTYHPVTLSNDDPALGIQEMLKALDAFPDIKIIITAVNSDTGNKKIESIYHAYANNNPERVFLINNLGHHRYLSALKECSLCVGNSSSGIIEAPALGTPTLNIGERQQGRLRATTIIDCAAKKNEIISCINKAMNPDFIDTAKKIPAPYGYGGASLKIKNILKNHNMSGIIIKKFYDL